MENKMNKSSIRYFFLATLAVLAMVLAAVQPVSAQEAGDEVEITGTVTAIDEEAGSFSVETEDGSYTVFPGEDFDFSTLEVGDTVEVEGILNEDGSIAALSINVEEEDPTDEEDDPSGGYFCVQSEVPHPFGNRLAERYGTEYETLQAWFCDGFGWGQIMLALQTGEITDGDAGELLDARRDGEGWGQIWQRLNLIGRPMDAGPSGDGDGDGRPDSAGPPNNGNGHGRPDSAGPNNKGNGNGHGRPDFAGPPAGRP